MQRMASADPFYAKPCAFENAILHNGLSGVLTAGWFEAAIISEQR
jgi:hypothetical protein